VRVWATVGAMAFRAESRQDFLGGDAGTSKVPWLADHFPGPPQVPDLRQIPVCPVDRRISYGDALDSFYDEVGFHGRLVFREDMC